MKVKKIAALAVGAAMVGATVGFASAQPTVPEIPKDFFVNADGTPNVKIVVGSNAAAMDVASAADIAVALGSLLYTTEQVEAQNAYVKIKAEYPPATLDEWTIYAYNFDTMTVDHGLTINGSENWATTYEELPGDYWWNGAAYAGNYTDWVGNFMVTTTIADKDKTGDEQLIDWHITLKNVQLSSKDPAEWDGTMPPKDADLIVTPGNVTVFVDYVLYNYTVSYTTEVRPAYPEWGVPAENATVTDWYIGDAENMAAAGGTEVGVYSPGVAAGGTFTVFGETYYVLSVGNDNFTAGLDKGTAWYQVSQPQAIEGTDWIVTVLDISIIDQRALVVVKNAVTGQESDQMILEKDTPVDVFGDGAVILTLRDTFVGIDGHLIASIEAQVDVDTYTSGRTIIYDGKTWEMEIRTNNGYITNITLTNLDTLEGNPVDIFGTYDLKYWFEMYTLNEAAVGYDIDGNGTIDDVDRVVAYAYIALTEKEGTVSEIELSVGDNVLDTEYYVAGIYADQVMVKPVASPITVMDYEVNLEDPGSNLILVGGPVANSVTQYLVEQGISQVDWYNSPGDIEYIQDALGGYDVVIVAGATRDETKAAAEALMEYLAGL
ncbi:S-layer protein [Thermococcus sp. GR7]|uniref:S-layer protein n=1 Tax=unclassified Thermococcus TaxID=2627626 RepID=UPI001430F515|nr:MULTISPECIES: S-layer protein [unclassified Thermococcus]NJE46395.1 S-layer protein [Thermococcus sp. GR7]NJE77686.1 S-layer protein [Thermococcus sp. GR4]NJF23725.1 S-layer protein [Thermococcus sp. GR5]